MNQFEKEHQKQFEILRDDLMERLDIAQSKGENEIATFMHWTMGAIGAAYAAIKVLQYENELLRMPDKKLESFVN